MATAKLSFTKLVVLALAAAVLVELSAAATHIVGDTTGWVNNPSGGATFYSNWASKQTFAIGDILVFNYVTGQHNVATVTKNAYDTCNPTSPISLATNGPTNITLNATGENYFFCTVGTHCTQGQKLAINVTSSTTAPSGAPSSPPATSPSPASPPPATTAPPPSPTASPPSPKASPPSPTASPPTPTASPPSPTASPPPSTTAPPPSSTASPPPPSAPSPGSPTSPTPGTSVSPPPPPASSAPPKAVAAFAVVLMSIAIGVMC